MFDNNNNVFAYRIGLKLDPYLVALFNLCFDFYIKLENVAINHDEVRYAVSLFSDDFYDRLGINKGEYLSYDENDQYAYTKDQFFNTLAVHLNSYYLKSDVFTSKINSKEYLFYFKDTFLIYSTISNKDNNKEISNNINNKFKSINLISEILEYVENQNLRESVQSISTIYEFNRYGKYIEVLNSDILKPQLLSLHREQLNFSLLNRELFDFDNVWINFDNDLCKELVFDTEKDEYYLLRGRETNTVVGLEVNDHVLLKYNVDVSEFIREEVRSKYIWQLFKEGLFRRRNQTSIHNSSIIADFRNRSKEKDFNKLLCNLRHNLYIDRNIKVKRSYKSFFEEFIIINKLDELSNFNFFLPDDKKEKELLGIYTDSKIGSKYNLIHYLKHKDENNLDSFVNSSPSVKVKEKVNILKAELSFYLVEKFYEDVIEEILSDLDLDFLSNIELTINGIPRAEFDFVIFKDDKFYFIEAKTTLSKDNIYETSKKYNYYIESLKMITNSDVSNFRFILAGLLSNSNLDSYKHFFDSKNVNYNSERRGFKSIPYRFDIPFFGHQKLKLECIAEPEFLKLKEFIKGICQI